jgi:hypothetical protein
VVLVVVVVDATAAGWAVPDEDALETPADFPHAERLKAVTMIKVRFMS